MGQRINDLNSLPSIPLDGNFALDTTTRTGKVSASDLKDFILEDVPFKFGVDGQGNYGYIKEGADTVTPFKSEADIEEAYQDGVHSITDNPEKLTLTSTNGTDVPVTAGYYDTVNTTAVYTAGSAAGQAAADAMVNPSSASYTAGYDDGIQSITSNPQKLTLDGTNGSNVDITDGYYGTVDTTAVYNAGAASVTGDPQKLTLDGTNGTNVDIVDGYYGVVDTTAVYAAGAASVTGDPQKLVLTSTNGANVDITDGYYGTVDTRAVYNAGAASITSNPQKLTLNTTNGSNVDITDGYYGTVDTTALYNAAYAAGQSSATPSEPTKLVLGTTSGSNVSITTGYYNAVDTTALYNKAFDDGEDSITSNPSTLVLGTTSGASVDITDGYYGAVDTTALYNVAYAAGQAAGGTGGGRNELLYAAAVGGAVAHTDYLGQQTFEFQDNYSQVMIVFMSPDSDNSGDNFMKVYSSAKANLVGDAVPPSSAWKDLQDEWSYFPLDGIVAPPQGANNVGIAATNSKYTNTQDYNKDVFRTLNDGYVISCIAYKNGVHAGDTAYIYATHGALFYIFGISTSLTAGKLVLTSTSGDDVDIDDGYYGSVDTTALYNAAYTAGYTDGGNGSGGGLASSITISYTGKLRTTPPTGEAPNDRSASGTAVFTRQANGSYALQSGGSISTTSNNYSSMLPMWTEANITGVTVTNDTASTLTLTTTNGVDVPVTPGYYDTVDTTALYNAGYDEGYTIAQSGSSSSLPISSVLKATLSRATTSGNANQSYTATQRCLAVASCTAFEGGRYTEPTTTGSVLRSGNPMVAILEAGQSISVGAIANGAYNGATTTLAVFALSS